MMEAGFTVIALSVLVEGLIQVVKGWVPTQNTNTMGIWIWQIASAIIGIGLCIVTETDLFPILAIPIHIAWVGQVVTGLIISRGAVFVHDIWDKINPDHTPKTPTA